ncbi:MAG: four helix bundle protein [Armatimonadetes bacterium]|nr:four helix bundle protein [Armatimonadota bacterium]
MGGQETDKSRNALGERARGRPPAKTFRDLVVWQTAHQFVLAVYKLTESFPRAGQFGLTAQLRRAALSIPANIAEGFRKRSDPDKGRFLNIAQGSVEECQYYLILAKDLGYADMESATAQLDEVSRLLTAYAASVLGARR